MKKKIALLLILCMFFSSLGITFGKNSSDIQSHWAKEVIEDWIEQGLIKGYPDGSFRPNNTITRAEFMVLVNKAFDFTDKENIDFTDVFKQEWYYNAVATAVSAGYIGGYPDGSMKPNNPISRQEVTVILSKVTKIAQKLEGINRFTDADKIADWAKGYVGAAVAEGYMGGYPDGTFKPLNNITRAEAVVTLNKTIKSLPDEVDEIKEEKEVVYDKSGIYGPEVGTMTIDKDVIISSKNVTLQNTIIKGSLTVAEEVGDGDVYLNNITVVDETFIRGGGKDSIHINGGKFNRIIVQKTSSGNVRIVAIDTDGLEIIIAKDARGEEIILEGRFDSVAIEADNIKLSTQGRTNIKEVVVKEGIKAIKLALVNNSSIEKLVANSKIETVGKGNIKETQGKEVEGSKFEKQPDKIIIPSTSGGGGGGGSSGSSKKAVTAVKLNKGTIELKVGEATDLVATVEPSDASNRNVIWTSSDEKVATVDSKGKVTAVSKGTATITVKTNNNKTATCKVSVIEIEKPEEVVNRVGLIAAINSVKWKLKNAIVGIGIGNYPQDAVDALTQSMIKAEIVADKLDATQEEINGAVTALNEAVVIFEATVIKVPDEYVVTVLINPNNGGQVTVTDAVYDEEKFSFKKGERVAVTAIANEDYEFKNWTDEEGNNVGTDTLYTFTMPENNIALKANFIKKLVAVEEVTLNKYTMTLLVGGASETIIATVLPDDATNKDIIWSSSNEEVATVVNGVVISKTTGTATITATSAADGAKTATCVVTVGSITMNIPDFTFFLGAEPSSSALTATVYPAGTVEWSNSNPEVATIQVNGNTVKITPVAVGTTTLTAKAGELSATCLVTVKPNVGNYTGTMKISGDYNSKLDGVEVKIRNDKGFEKTAISGTDGKFIIEDIPNGEYTLSFSKAGYIYPRESNNRVLIMPGSFDNYNTIYMKVAIPISFQVTGTNGTLTAKVVTTGGEIVYGSPSSLEKFDNLVFTANPDIGYQVKEWKVNGEVVAGNTSNTYAVDHILTETNVTIEFEEVKPEPVTVTVTVETTSSDANFKIKLSPAIDISKENLSLKLEGIDKTINSISIGGEYNWIYTETLERGKTYILTITKAGYNFGEPVSVTIPTVGTITGRITDINNVPLEGVKVDVGFPIMKTVTTGADGKYIANDIIKGTHEVSFSKEGYKYKVIENVEVTGAVTVDVQLDLE